MLSELMGGSVGVKSKLGEGSTFYFSILGKAATSKVARKSVSLRTSDFSASRNLNILLGAVPDNTI